MKWLQIKLLAIFHMSGILILATPGTTPCTINQDRRLHLEDSEEERGAVGEVLVGQVAIRALRRVVGHVRRQDLEGRADDDSSLT